MCIIHLTDTLMTIEIKIKYKYYINKVNKIFAFYLHFVKCRSQFLLGLSRYWNSVPFDQTLIQAHASNIYLTEYT